MAERNRKWADAIEPALEQCALRLFDRASTAVSAADCCSHSFWWDAMLTGIGQCVRRGYGGEDPHPIHPPSLAFANHGVCIKLQNSNAGQGRQPLESNL